MNSSQYEQYRAAQRAHDRDEIYRARPTPTLPEPVTFTNDGGRAVASGYGFDPRIDPGSAVWRMDA